MEIIFYVAGLVAVFTTLRVITHTNPMHALLYLIAMVLAISAVFFSLGAYFIAGLQVIIYMGAIIVLFVFVVMMLNLEDVRQQERSWTKMKVWIGPSLISSALLVVLIIAVQSLSNQGISSEIVDTKNVGMYLFGPYLLAVELASMLLLSGLVVAFHVGHEKKYSEVISNVSTSRQKITRHSEKKA
ncbi:NADH-quinone oxidoreductase subunit J [Candidatus Gillettellia adelgis]